MTARTDLLAAEHRAGIARRKYQRVLDAFSAGAATERDLALAARVSDDADMLARRAHAAYFVPRGEQ